MDFARSLPSEQTDDGDVARALASSLGTAYAAPDGSNNAADALALAGALVDARSVLKCALDEAFEDTAWDLLSELETRAGLPVRTDLAPSDRQARLVAKRRAARGAQPQRILRAVNVIDPTATIVEHSTSDATYQHELDGPVSSGAARGVFVLSVVVATSVWNDPTKLAVIRAIVAQMSPAHAMGVVCTGVGFVLGVSLLGSTAF